MANYWEYKLVNARPRLKADVHPHKFDCQKGDTDKPERAYVVKKRKVELIEEAEAMARKEPEAVAGSSKCNQSEIPIEEAPAAEDPTKSLSDKAVQVKIKPLVRSKATNTTSTSRNVALSPIKPSLVSTMTSPIKFNMASIYTSSESSSVSENAGESEYEVNEDSECSSYKGDDEVASQEFKENMQKCFLLAIEREPRLMLGLPEKSYYLVKILSAKVPAPLLNILIVLKKIRLNDSFAILALHFGMSVSNISRIFSKTVPILAQLLEQLIYWPESKKVRLHLPIPFRARYKSVVSIIDCLEIQIEKPSNAVHQALTWSQYKGCNTLKYLISCTPDGLVSYISCGYGGRATDIVIVEDCGYLNHLQPGSTVMADRGFKNISTKLEQIGCGLVRPPSVSADVRSTKEEVKTSKQIAALRIHVERVIGRLREFKMLLPHACIDHNHIPCIDNIVKIACGIINMQDYIIKIQI